jgi:hypothetical protein
MKAELYGNLAGILAIYDSKHPKGKQPAFKKAGRQLSVVAGACSQGCIVSTSMMRPSRTATALSNGKAGSMVHNLRAV